MDVITVNIRKIFEQEVQYIIPLFQRHYVWDKEGQWIPLWKDIETKAKKRMNEHGRGKLSHFTGAIVIQQKPSNVNEINAYEIIDGQQRLTTFQLIICVLRNVYKKLNGKVNRVEKYMLNSDRDDEDEVIKLKPTKYDLGALQNIFGGNLSPKGNLYDAYNYFKNQIDHFVQDDINRATILLNTILEDFNLVQIRIDGDDEPEMIFESLNARRKELLAFDLLRNNLFLRTRQEHKEDRDELYRQFWQHFESKKWDKLTELFLQHFLMAKLGTDKVGPSLFNTYQRQYQTKLSEDTTVKNELEEFHKYSNIYQDIIDDKSDMSNAMLVYNTMGITTLRPFFLYLITEVNLQGKQIDYVFHALESYVMRRAITDGTGHGHYSDLFSHLIEHLRNKGGFYFSGFLEFMKKESADSNRWPRNNDFSENFYATPKVMRYILYRMERYHRKNNKGLSEDNTLSYEGLTLEHIMPKKWKDHWLLPSSHEPVNWNDIISEKYKKSHATWDIYISEENIETALTDSSYRKSYDIAQERKKHLEKIGNFTLLTRKLNAKSKHKPFVQKKELMYNHSTLLINKELCKKENWDVDDIKSRSRELYKTFCEIWPDVDWFLNNIPRD